MTNINGVNYLNAEEALDKLEESINDTLVGEISPSLYIQLIGFKAQIAHIKKYKWHDLRKDPTDLPKLETGYEWFECVHEEHENDPFYANYQYDEEYGFGEWHDIFDNGTYGFIDSEFESVEDMGYTPIVGWRYIKPFEEE